MKVKAIIFDLDGTLADTIEAIRDGINITMRQYGYPERSYEDVRRAIGNGARLLVKRCMPAAAAEDAMLCDAVFKTYHAAYAETYLHTQCCYDGIVEAVSELYRRGIRLAILSNKQDAYVKGLAEQLFPNGEISIAMGQTELPTKPDPTVPLMIARQLGVSPADCAFVGDSEVDIRTAKNAGMHAVGCSWGYRDAELLQAEGAEILLTTPSQLMDVFESRGLL